MECRTAVSRVLAVSVVILIVFLRPIRGDPADIDNCESSTLSKEDCEMIAALHLQGPIHYNAGPIISEASKDFGGININKPAAVLQPAVVDDIVKIMTVANASSRLTIAARGNGHSLGGQAEAFNGIVVEMLPSIKGIQIFPGNATAAPYVDADGGALWVDLLTATLPQGLAPRSWTDYISLSVAGTLSNAGISGQTHRFGPQIRNVLQLDVVTGKGELITGCSSSNAPELFYGALGGLGQFGIITKARIVLQKSPQRARQMRLVYWKLEDLMRDQELLISLPEGKTFDYIEGFVVINTNDPLNGWPSVPFSSNQTFNPALIPPNAGPVIYYIEAVFNYNQGTDVNGIIQRIISPLGFIKGLQFSQDVSYFDFLNRVHAEEEAFRKNGIWFAPHAWLNLFIPKSKLVQFDATVFKNILSKGVDGPMIVYPLFKNKWDSRMSAVFPDEDMIFYVVSILRFNKPYPDGPDVKTLLAQNEQILQFCRTNGIAFKEYLARHETQSDWQQHFGPQWSQFQQRKAMFDPKGILAPGQNIFPRSN